MATTLFKVKLALLLLLATLPLSGRACDMAVIPSTDVNLATHVRDVLNAAGGSVTNDCLTFFQERAKLNIWSKYKPVISDISIKLSDLEFKAANYGLVINAVNGYSPAGSWAYAAPTAIFRISDFVGYMTNEEAPLIMASAEQQTWNKLESAVPELGFTVAFKMAGAAYHGAVNSRINIEDLSVSNNGSFSFKDLYLVAAYSSDAYAICPYPLSAGNAGGAIGNVEGTSLANTLKSLAIDNTYSIYLFLTNRSDAIGWSIPMPVAMKVDLTIVSEYWLKFYVTFANLKVGDINVLSCNTNNVSHNPDIKSYVLGLSDTTTVTVSYSIRIRRRNLQSLTRLDIKELRINTPINDGYVKIDKMEVHNLIRNGSLTAINKTFNYSDTNTSYLFDAFGSSESDYNVYYNVTLVCSVPAKTLKSNAGSDANLPSTASFSLIPSFQINYEGIGSAAYQEDLKGYRFS